MPGARRSTDRRTWYCRVENEEIGPLSSADLRKFIRDGVLQSQNEIRDSASGTWKAIAERPELATEGVVPSTAAADVLARRHRAILEKHVGKTPAKPSRLGGSFSAFNELISDLATELVNIILNLLSQLGVARLLLHSRLFLVVILIAFVAIVAYQRSFRWGRPPDPYVTYEGIYDELKWLRSQQASETDWNRFAEYSRTETDRIVADLRPHATTRDPDTMELFWIGRDYLPKMLHDAREHPSRSEALFHEHMQRVYWGRRREEYLRQKQNAASNENVVAWIILADAVLIFGGGAWIIARKARTG